MWNGFKVIDSDAHHHEPMDMWDRYLEPDFRDRVPKVIGMRRNFYVYAHDDKLSPVLDAAPRYPRTTINGWRTSTVRLMTNGGRLRFALPTWIDTAGTFRSSSRPTATASWRLP